jgi:glutaredoxin
MIKNIIIYSASWCGPCRNAKRLLTERNLSYEEIDIEEVGMSREDLYEKTGGRTIPQIIINDINIGGYDDLLLLDKDGSLKT